MRLLAIIALASTALAQQLPRYVSELPQIYTAERDTTLSAAAEVVTVQQTAAGARNIKLIGAYVYCAVDCEFVQERNGTAATSTGITVKKVNPETAAATATAYHTSNVGVGTVLPTIKLSAGTDRVLDLAHVFLVGAGTAKNYTIRTNAITGRVIIWLMWQEYTP